MPEMIFKIRVFNSYSPHILQNLGNQFYMTIFGAGISDRETRNLLGEYVIENARVAEQESAHWQAIVQPKINQFYEISKKNIENILKKIKIQPSLQLLFHADQSTLSPDLLQIQDILLDNDINKGIYQFSQLLYQHFCALISDFPRFCSLITQAVISCVPQLEYLIPLQTTDNHRYFQETIDFLHQGDLIASKILLPTQNLPIDNLRFFSWVIAENLFKNELLDPSRRNAIYLSIKVLDSDKDLKGYIMWLLQAYANEVELTDYLNEYFSFAENLIKYANDYLSVTCIDDYCLNFPNIDVTVQEFNHIYNKLILLRNSVDRRIVKLKRLNDQFLSLGDELLVTDPDLAYDILEKIQGNYENVINNYSNLIEKINIINSNVDYEEGFGENDVNAIKEDNVLLEAFSLFKNMNQIWDNRSHEYILTCEKILDFTRVIFSHDLLRQFTKSCQNNSGISIDEIKSMDLICLERVSVSESFIATLEENSKKLIVTKYEIGEFLKSLSTKKMNTENKEPVRNLEIYLETRIFRLHDHLENIKAQISSLQKMSSEYKILSSEINNYLLQVNKSDDLVNDNKAVEGLVTAINRFSLFSKTNGVNGDEEGPQISLNDSEISAHYNN